MSSEYPAIPLPTADLQNLAEVARALKETVETLTRQRGTETGWAATYYELQTKAAAASADSASIADALANPALDAIFKRAQEDAEKLVQIAQADAQSALTELQTALENFKNGVTDDAAVVNARIDELSATVDQNTAAITTEEITRATEDSALSGRIDTVSASTTSNAAAITAEAVARANADSALGVRIDNVTSVTGSSYPVFIQSTTPTATTVGQLWIDTANQNLLKKWSGTAWVAESSTNLNAVIASVGSEAITRTNADSSISTRIDNLVSVAGDGNSATINGVSLTTATRTSALANQITSVQATANNASANGYYRLTALSNPTDGSAAEFATQVTASSGGSFYSAGMNIQVWSNGVSRIKMRADQFIFTDGSGNYTPFAIAGGQLIANAVTSVGNVSGLGALGLVNKLTSGNLATYMDYGVISTAFIGDAEITNAKIASVNANKIVASSLSSITANIGTVTAGSIVSANGKMTINLDGNYLLMAD